MSAELLDEFIRRYGREYDFFAAACRLCAERCEKILEEAGIRAIVTSRAKRPDRLGPKLQKRAAKRANKGEAYNSLDDIYSDIVDLAGVRVALYFPGDRDEVQRIITENFCLLETPKKFPQWEQSDDTQPVYVKKFSGYGATHLRVTLNSSPEVERYVTARVEIQIASVLMHAWAEVEHDLVYKPETGALSEDEHAVLDQINGLVIAGEIALERLQRAVQRRVSQGGKSFGNHYELGAHLMRVFRAENRGLSEIALGRVDLLYRLLARAGLATPDGLKDILNRVTDDFEKRPLAEQVSDHVLSLKPDLVGFYRQESDGAASPQDPQAEVVGRFLEAWRAFERAVELLGKHKGISVQSSFPTTKLLQQLGIDKRVINRVINIIHIRNQVVHHYELVPPVNAIIKATEVLEQVTAALESEKQA